MQKASLGLSGGECLSRAAARRLKQALLRSPCAELHITGGGAAIKAGFIAFALRRIIYSGGGSAISNF